MRVSAEQDVSFVCFTDQPDSVEAFGWHVRPLQSSPALKRGHDINRYHKFFAYHLFPEAEWSIYIDGNVRFDGQLTDLIQPVRKHKSDIGTFCHPHRHSLRKEAEVCSLSKFDAWDFSKVEQQLAASAEAGVDLDAIIPACYILVRDHASTRLPAAMSLWWSQIFEYTKRDQMSFPLILKRSGLKHQPLDGEGGVNPARVNRVSHARPPIIERAVRRARLMLSAKN